MTSPSNGERSRLPQVARPGSLRRWFDEMESMMRWPGGRWPFQAPWFQRLEPWAPAVDVFEKDTEVVVRADLPGVKQDDISVEVDQQTLVIRAERKQEEDVEEKGYRRTERSYGRYERTLALPDGVDADAIRATYREGVLEVRLPVRREEKTPAKTIPVK